MLDTRLRKLIDPALDRLAALPARLGVSANAVTVAGFLVGVGACVCVAFGHFLTALALVGVNRVCDGLDGAVARRTGKTDLGGYLDIVLDFLFYSGVPFAFAVHRQEHALPAAFLVYSFVGTGGSFLAFAVVSAKRGVTEDAAGHKSFFYAVGLAEGAETILALALMCVFPENFAAIAWTFGAICWVTTAARLALAVRVFSPN